MVAYAVDTISKVMRITKIVIRIKVIWNKFAYIHSNPPGGTTDVLWWLANMHRYAMWEYKYCMWHFVE